MAYHIKTSRIFEADFVRLDSLTQTRVLVALEKMRLDPFRKTKKLLGQAVGAFRVRIGDYRLRFDITKNDIYLYRIRHRKEVYRN